FDGQLARAPSAMPQMLVALDWLRSKPKQIVIAGKPGAPDTQAMLREVRRHFLPIHVLIVADGDAGQEFFAQRVEFMKSVAPIREQATAYVCENFVCQLPTTNLAQLSKLLTGGPATAAR
nr:thioredoxin domain-containing protein [Chthoniobacterales bacterium]